MGALLTQPGSRTTRSLSRSSCTATLGQSKSSDAFLGSFKRYASIEDNALLFFSLHDQISPSRQIVGVMFSGMMLGFQMLLRDQPTIIMGGEEEEKALEPNPLEQFCSIKYSRLKLILIVVIILLLVRGFNGSWWSEEELQWRDLEGNLVTWDFTNNQTSGNDLHDGDGEHDDSDDSDDDYTTRQTVMTLMMVALPY